MLLTVIYNHMKYSNVHLQMPTHSSFKHSLFCHSSRWGSYCIAFCQLGWGNCYVSFHILLRGNNCVTPNKTFCTFTVYPLGPRSQQSSDQVLITYQYLWHPLWCSISSTGSRPGVSFSLLGGQLVGYMYNNIRSNL